MNIAIGKVAIRKIEKLLIERVKREKIIINSEKNVINSLELLKTITFNL